MCEREAVEVDEAQRVAGRPGVGAVVIWALFSIQVDRRGVPPQRAGHGTSGRRCDHAPGVDFDAQVNRHIERRSDEAALVREFGERAPLRARVRHRSRGRYRARTGRSGTCPSFRWTWPVAVDSDGVEWHALVLGDRNKRALVASASDPISSSSGLQTPSIPFLNSSGFATRSIGFPGASRLRV